MKLKTVKERLLGIADSVGLNKKGQFIARRGFFYTFGKTSQLFANSIVTTIPEANIIEHGSVYKTFKGGANLAQSSHFWVTFTILNLD